MGIEALKRSVLVMSAAFVLGGCGYSQTEMDAKQHEVDRLSAELKTSKQQLDDDKKKYSEALAQADVVRQLYTLGMVARSSTPQALDELMTREMERWARIVRN